MSGNSGSCTCCRAAKMKKIVLPEAGIETLFGSHDANLKHIESLLDVRLSTHGNQLIVDGDGDVKTAAGLLVENTDLDLRDYFLRGGQKQAGRRRVNPKSVNQRRYLDAIERFDIVFGVGPAGTGKTYLAMAQAVSYLLSKKVTRIILARPAVEAGEKLGFLPGDLQEKV